MSLSMLFTAASVVNLFLMTIQQCLIFYIDMFPALLGNICVCLCIYYNTIFTLELSHGISLLFLLLQEEEIQVFANTVLAASFHPFPGE